MWPPLKCFQGRPWRNERSAEVRITEHRITHRWFFSTPPPGSALLLERGPRCSSSPSQNSAGSLNVFNQLIKAKRIQIVAKILNQYGSENKYGLILKKDGNSFRFADSEPSENFEEDLKAFLKNMIEDLKKDEDSACLFIVICSENKII